MFGTDYGSICTSFLFIKLVHVGGALTPVLLASLPYPPSVVRVITGQNMFVTDYVNRGDRTSKVGLGTDVPSKIVRLPLAAYGGEVICQRGAFLAGSHTIDIQVGRLLVL